MLRLSILVAALLLAGCESAPQSDRKTVELDLPAVEYSK
jgi:uncharacterized lipoprotein YajG